MIAAAKKRIRRARRALADGNIEAAKDSLYMALEELGEIELEGEEFNADEANSFEANGFDDK